MSWTNYHTHCCFCDGTGEPCEYAAKSLKTGIKGLGFSCHAPLPFDTTWTMTESAFEEYCRTIRGLKKEYTNRLNISLGLEIDYIPAICEPSMDVFRSADLDYMIGSVHFIEYDGMNEYLTADSTGDEFITGLEHYFNGNIRKAVERYYFLVRKMIEKGGFDIVGHLDLIKKNNSHDRFFHENESWYRNAVCDTLSAVSESGLIIEVNTGGISRNYIDTPYPSAWILELCHKMKLPVMLNSDAHNPENITACFEETAKMLLDIGFTELYILGKSGWEPRPFTANGITF